MGIRPVFQYRELGWCSWLGDVGRVAFEPLIAHKYLGLEDRQNWHFLHNYVYGLPYRPMPSEELGLRPEVTVMKLWKEFRTDHRDRVAFKGGT